MIKLRAQGTKNDLKWLRKQLERIDVFHIISCSEIYSNVGTDKYYRMYVDIGRSPYRKQHQSEQRYEKPGKRTIIKWKPENRHKSHAPQIAAERNEVCVESSASQIKKEELGKVHPPAVSA